MKFAVGFQLYEPGELPFSQIVRTHKDRISEVFFPWLDLPTGRSGIASQHGFCDWSAQSRLEEELRAIKATGIKLDLLFNGNCYGQYAISEKLANTVTSLLAHLEEEPVEPETNMTVIVDGKEYVADLVNGTPVVVTGKDVPVNIPVCCGSAAENRPDSCCEAG